MARIEATGPNAEQITYWNEQAGPKWVNLQQRLDEQLLPFGQIVMDRLGIAEGERVLDIGCGCGETTLDLARRVGSDGSVLGVDISNVMLDRARDRGAAVPNAVFLAADAQTYGFAAGSFDVIFSRFGVMFFQDPRAAFKNLVRALRSGGRIGFHCWKTFQDNPWMTVPCFAALQHVPPPPPPQPGAPGPFAFADPDHVRSILSDAGLAEIDFESRTDTMTMGGASSGEAKASIDDAVGFAMQMGPASIAIREATPETIEKVRASIHAALVPFTGPKGVTMATSSWVVTARKL